MNRTIAMLAQLIAYLAVYSPTVAQERLNEQRATMSAPGVLFWFQGDVTGNNVSNVLAKLYSSQSSSFEFQQEKYTVREKDTVCGILEERGYPPPCDGYLPLLDSLNRDANLPPLSRRPLQTGMTINLPGFRLTEQSWLRVFSKDDKAQSKVASTLEQSLRDYDAHRVEPNRSNDSYAVKFNSYKLLIPTSTDEAAQSLYQEVKPLGTRNVLITPVTKAAASGAKFNSYQKFRSSSQIQADCIAGSLNDKLEKYGGLLDGDQNAVDAMAAGLAPKTPLKVPVVIIDTILRPAPNIVQNFSGASQQLAGPASVPAAPPWTCKWASFVDVQNHATHMAGLIAGSGKPFAFQGVTDNVLLASYEWWVPDSLQPDVAIKGRPDREVDLSDYLMSSYQDANVLPIYLAALQFDDYFGAALDAPEKRFANRPLESTIRDARPLVITAAGQPSKPGDPIISISNTSPVSPQNLGNLENVVVVTACVVCSTADPAAEPKLMADAYYSAAGQRMVHIAAPGAEPIAGWIDEKSIGEAMGTSQAAAYVAGLAASMIGYFNDAYSEAKYVKIRLQVTSRPIPPRNDYTENSDAGKIAAGVVDPVLARLDPTKHWLKDGGSWKSVKISKWPVATIGVTNMVGKRVDVKRDAILRISRTKLAKGGAPSLWTYYVNAFKAKTGPPGDVDRYDFLKTITPSTITLCDGTTISADKIEDFIVSAQGVGVNECAS